MEKSGKKREAEEMSSGEKEEEKKRQKRCSREEVDAEDEVEEAETGGGEVEEEEGGDEREEAEEAVSNLPQEKTSPHKRRHPPQEEWIVNPDLYHRQQAAEADGDPEPMPTAVVPEIKPAAEAGPLELEERPKLLDEKDQREVILMCSKVQSQVGQVDAQPGQMEQVDQAGSGSRPAQPSWWGGEIFI